MNYKVRNFEYDGFGCAIKKGFAPYTATLVKWTLDPGVGLLNCTDGVERLIPICVLPDFKGDWVKPPDAPVGYSPLLYVGEPSKS